MSYLTSELDIVSVWAVFHCHLSHMVAYVSSSVVSGS